MNFSRDAGGNDTAALGENTTLPSAWRTFEDVQPILCTAEWLAESGAVDAAIDLLQPTVYNPEATTSPINKLAAWGQWPRIVQYLAKIAEYDKRITNPKDRLALHMTLGTAYERIFSYPEARTHLDLALTLAREQADVDAESFVLSRFANMLAENGDSIGSLNLYYDALALARRAGNHVIESTLLSNIGYTYKGLGQNRYAITFFEHAWRISRRSGDLDFEIYYGLNIAEALLDLGVYEDALGFTDQYLLKTREIGERDLEAYMLAAQGEALVELGLEAEAAEVWDECLAVAQKAVLPTQQIMAHIGRADLALRANDLARARVEIKRAESDSALMIERGTFRPYISLLTMLMRALLTYREGDFERAKARYNRICDVAAASQNMAFEALARIGLARIAQDEAKMVEALDQLIHAYTVIAESDHRSHAQTVAALRQLAAVWPDFGDALASASGITTATLALLHAELDL